VPAKKVNPFKLKDFLGVDPEHIARLDAQGIRTTMQILSAGRTPEARRLLAEKTGIPEDKLTELVRLSDLSRLPGVKSIRARLYIEAGVDSVENMAGWDPQALLQLTAEFVRKTGFLGIAPLPKEVSSTITNAKKLEKMIKW